MVSNSATTLLEPLKTTAEFYVRYAETDAQGIVHHAAYIVWFEEARSHYARSRGTNYADFERAGYLLSVVSVQARYSYPARYGELVAVSCWIESLSSRAVSFKYEVKNALTGQRLVTGESRHICVNRQGQPVIIPPEWRSWLND